MTDTPDLESRAAPDDHHALRLWLRMLTCANLIEGEIRSRLRNDFDTTLPRFDLMAQLQRAPKGMKMGELSLLPAVRKADADTLVIADGTSCRHQIHDGAGREALHVARVLRMALGSRPGY